MSRARRNFVNTEQVSQLFWGPEALRACVVDTPARHRVEDSSPVRPWGTRLRHFCRFLGSEDPAAVAQSSAQIPTPHMAMSVTDAVAWPVHGWGGGHCSGGSEQVWPGTQQAPRVLAFRMCFSTTRGPQRPSLCQDKSPRLAPRWGLQFPSLPQGQWSPWLSLFCKDGPGTSVPPALKPL